MCLRAPRVRAGPCRTAAAALSLEGIRLSLDGGGGPEPLADPRTSRPPQPTLASLASVPEGAGLPDSHQVTSVCAAG